MAGREGRVLCAVEADPPPTINWFHPDGTLVSASQLARIQSAGNGTLLFITTLSQDGGEYTCEAVNALGHSSATVLVEVYGEGRRGQRGVAMHGGVDVVGEPPCIRGTTLHYDITFVLSSYEP